MQISNGVMVATRGTDGPAAHRVLLIGDRLSGRVVIDIVRSTGTSRLPKYFMQAA